VGCRKHSGYLGIQDSSAILVDHPHKVLYLKSLLAVCWDLQLPRPLNQFR
jgi:hypothetical protein